MLRQKLKWIEFLRGGKTKGHAPGNRINHDNIAFHEAKKNGVALPTSSK